MSFFESFNHLLSVNGAGITAINDSEIEFYNSRFSSHRQQFASEVYFRPSNRTGSQNIPELESEHGGAVHIETLNFKQVQLVRWSELLCLLSKISKVYTETDLPCW